MRGLRSVAVALALSLPGAGTARAGVYNPAEPEWKVTDRFDEFRSTVRIPLRQFGTPEGKDQLHRRYAFLAGLAARVGTANLTAEQRLSLGAYLIRERKYRDAVSVLSPAQRLPQERDNFLIYASLATAEYLDGQAQRARDYLADALRMWPRDWSRLSKARREGLEKMGWDEQRYQWYRRAETYLLKLLRLRARERPAAGGQASPLGTGVEPLFDDGGSPAKPVRFVGESGQYEAGKIAAAEKAKLPEDAVRLVEQLLVWMPDDVRLYWLLGELLNARGEYLSAGEVFTEIGDSLQIGARGAFDPVAKQGAPGPQKVRALSRRSLDEFTRLPEVPKQHLAVLIAKAKADEAALAAADRKEREPAAQGVAPPPGGRRGVAPPAASNTLPIDMRSLAVGFVAGLVVMVFALWQVREVRRRLQARAAAPVARWPGPGEGVPVKREEGRPG